MRPDRDVAGVGATFLEEDSNGWLVTFSDLVLQLFAFVLVAAVLGPGRAVLPGVDETIAPSVAVEGVPQLTIGPPDALSLARFDDLPPPAPVPPVEAEPPARSTAPAAAVAVVEPVAPVDLAPTASLAADLERFVADAGLAEAVQVALSGGGVTLSISDTIGFASGQADLLPDAGPMLAKVRSLVAARAELAVEVAGHTDDVPVHGGPFASNLDLSLARAARVAHELAAGDAGVAARTFAAGYGPQRPVASNLDAEGRARNRRVEIRLVPHPDGSAG